MKKVLNVIFVILAVCVIVIPICFINLEPNKVSSRENRYLANFPTVGVTDPKFGSQFKSWLNDNIGFRDELLNMRTQIMYNGMNIVTSEKVHRGKDGWFFYTYDNNLELSSGEYPLSDDYLESILIQQTAIRDKLAARGTEYVLVLPASKVSIYPEYVGYSSNEQVIRSAADIVADYIEGNSDIRVVRLKDALLKDKQENNKQLYFKTDTHWNEYGAYVAYKEINRKLNEWGLIDSDIPDVSLVDGEFVGEFSAMLGCPGLLGAEPTINTVINDPSAVRDTSEVADYLQSMHNNAVYHYLNSSIKDCKALVFGDSLFGNWNMTELLAENFSELTYVWDTNINESYINYTDPDIVICEIGERYLNILADRSVQYIADPLSDFNAEIESTRLAENRIEVTVKNTSSAEWTANKNVRIGLFVDDIDTGMRGRIDYGITVKPGDTYTFFISTEGSTLDMNKVTLQMLQEGVTYFGNKVAIPYDANNKVNDAEIVSNTAPSTVNHTDSYTMEITVRNTGNTIWDNQANYKLCIWQDYMDCGYRLLIPNGKTVKPGEEYTFTLQGFVLPEAPETTLEFQMVIEGECYFGEKEPVHITCSE